MTPIVAKLVEIRIVPPNAPMYPTIGFSCEQALQKFVAESPATRIYYPQVNVLWWNSLAENGNHA